MSWWLKNITEEQYREVYIGTPGMDIIDLFRVEPQSDRDYFENYFYSKLFRLNSGIYTIVTKKGERIPFEMNYAQHRAYAASLRHSRLLILKSRQQGISTFWLLSFIDDAITKDNMFIGLMSQGKAESKTLFERVTTALEGLPPKVVEFLNCYVVKDNSEAISFTNKSMMYIQTSFRSGTLQRLHISEMGKIASKYPEKARETKAGSLQAIAPGNTVVIESTAEGRNNMFYSMWYEAASYVGERTGMDFLPVFLSWVDDPDCRVFIPQTIHSEAEEYFAQCERNVSVMKGSEFKLSKEQKWWWVSKFRELQQVDGGNLIYQEYPATPEEAFAAVRDGAYYARAYQVGIKEAGREVTKLYDPMLPVYAACDLGRNDVWVTVYFQVGLSKDSTEYRIIGEYHNTGEAILHYVNEAKTRPWKVARWYLPHDAKVKDLSIDKSRADLFRSYGCKVSVLRKASSRENDIEIVRKHIPYMWIDVEECSYLVDTFYSYSKKWDDRAGTWANEHLHNEWSNPADALRYMVMSNVKIPRPEKKVKRAGGLAL